jgi:hypothetical protein
MAYERDSYMVSDYHRLFVEMGYPELDILKYPDGEWHIIQYYSRPIIPCLTKWQVVLGPMRNVDISRGFLEKYIRQCDITKRAFWDREERKTHRLWAGSLRTGFKRWISHRSHVMCLGRK